MKTHSGSSRRVATAAGLAAIFAAAALVARRAFPARVIGTSMLPTLEPGDLVACVKPLRRVRRNDVVVAAGQPVRIKRVAAVAGQRYGAEMVRSGRVFLVGDNLRASTDSRATGTVPERDIMGVARAIYWPPRRIRRIR